MGKKIAPAEVGGEIAVINEDLLKDKVYTIRGVKVMLDADLAEIYGYSVKAFNQQVKNNIEKFPEDFRFQINKEEIDCLSRSKILTSMQVKGIKGGRSYLPYAFTEQGIYMLMTVLKGDLATEKFYHCGTSSKDAGSKVTTVMQIFDKDGYYPLIGRVLNLT